MPAHNEELLIEQSISSIPDNIDLIVVVNDGSIDNTEVIVQSLLKENGVSVTTPGLGVGGAIALGYREVAKHVTESDGEFSEWAVVVMAGDGQMHPADIEGLLKPLKEVPFVKGNRWIHPDGLGNMPRHRRIGSRVLGVLTSLASGQKVSDPQCGYTAVRLSDVTEWSWVESWTGYGYPNWWMVNVGADSIPFASVPVKSVYRNEKSGIRMKTFFPKICLLLLKGLWKRGWGWYVKGKGNTPASTRLVVSSTWFCSLLLLATFPVLIYLDSSNFFLVPAILGLFLVTWKLDQIEVDRRLQTNPWKI